MKLFDPRKTGHACHRLRIVFEGTESSDQMILNSTHTLKDLVSKPILSDTPPEVFNRVELRTIWGKEHQVHIPWDFQPSRSVPTRSVKNHQDELVRVPPADLFKKQRHGPLVYLGGSTRESITPS